MNKENSILFLGDVAPYRPYRFNSDCRTVINLECPLARNDNPVTGKIILGTAENHLRSIFSSKLLCVNLGNNHILDYGKPGLDSTIQSLNRANIRYFGLNNIEGNNPLLITFNECRIGFLSAVCETTSPVFVYEKINYLSALDVGTMIRKISEIRNTTDRIVVYLHWGEEESSLPTSRDLMVARKLIDAGADIIIGSHAHAPQPVERYRNGIIAHNLGNFIMPGMKDNPSYYDEKGNPGMYFSSRMMLWNRISWGIMIDMLTMEFRIRKFMFTGSRVVELPFTPYDKFLKLPKFQSDQDYSSLILKHQNSRKLQRRIVDFIFNPHIPQKLKLKS